MKPTINGIVQDPVRARRTSPPSRQASVVRPSSAICVSPGRKGGAATARRHAGAASSSALLSPTPFGGLLWTREMQRQLEESILAVARDYVDFKVASVSAAAACSESVSIPVSRAAAIMRSVGKRLETRHQDTLEFLFSQLHMDSSTVYETFVGIVRELFIDGINWGRFAVLFCFAGNVAAHCALDVDMAELVPSVITWLARFVSEELCGWICENGGLDGFCEHFSQTAHAPHGNGLDLTVLMLSVAEGALVSVALATVGIALSWLVHKTPI